MNNEIKEYVIKFHNTYEKLAPNYGYETRKDTKELDFNSNNGKLMYATINEIITPLLDYITNLQQEKEDYKSRCEKAVEYIKENKKVVSKYEAKDTRLPLDTFMWGVDNLSNILDNGSDEE